MRLAGRLRRLHAYPPWRKLAGCRWKTYLNRRGAMGTWEKVDLLTDLGLMALGWLLIAAVAWLTGRMG